MINRLTKDTRAIVEEAAEIAREMGATSIEAEHLLLAIVQGESAAARLLDHFGLDFDGLMGALREETTRSLAAVGISAEPPHFSPYLARPRLGTSAKKALENMLRVAVVRREKELTPTHLAAAIVQPDHGTVPRALECAGVDREALRAAL